MGCTYPRNQTSKTSSRVPRAVHVETGMQFSDWQLDRLRRALNNYRIDSAKNGRLLPWKTVIDRLLMSAETHHQYAEDGAEPGFKEEALRRFAVGKSTLQPDKLEDLRDFLIAQKVLAPDELDSDPAELQGLLAIRTHLANESERSKSYLALFGEGYKVVRTDSIQQIKLCLRASLDRSGTFMRVEEEYEVSWGIEPPNADLLAKDRNTSVRQRRKGFAFVSTPENHLHVFLRGASPDDRVSFLQVKAGGQMQREPIDKLPLLRTGTFPDQYLGVHPELGPESQMVWGNVFRFLSLRPGARTNDIDKYFYDSTEPSF